MKTTATHRGLLCLSACIITWLSVAVAQTPPAAGALSEDQLPPRDKPLYHCARLAAEWLYQANETDGRFRPGLNPAVNMPLPDEGFIPQAHAARALAQAARIFGEGRYGARAKQAILTLLAQTKLDSQNANIRYTTLPTAALNKATAASLTVWAIHELPDPAKDLLEQSEQLVNFLRTTQAADGSFVIGEQPAALPHQKPDGLAQQHLATHGIILAALVRSHGRSPAVWKLESARKALAFYHSHWQANRMTGPTPGLMIGFADAYRLTREKSYADAVLEMGDWLLSLQYVTNNQQPLWEGGFASWKEGKLESTLPTTAAAPLLEALGAALQTANAVGDAGRVERFRSAIERGGQFLITQQYTSANVTHYADWFQRGLVGSFFTSFEMGANPLAGTAWATSALAGCLPELAQAKPK